MKQPEDVNDQSRRNFIKNAAIATAVTSYLRQFSLLLFIQKTG